MKREQLFRVWMGPGESSKAKLTSAGLMSLEMCSRAVSAQKALRGLGGLVLSSAI